MSDYYDVQNMLRDARSDIRSEIRSEIRDAVTELRRDVWTIVDELREGLGQERVDRQNAIGEAMDAMQRVIDSRTSHLV